MISASLSLSLPRLGWESTSMPRSLNICTAAGDKASEMRTLGLGIGASFERMKRRPGRSATWREEPGPGESLGAISPPSPRSYGERAGGRGTYKRSTKPKSPSPGATRRPLPVRTGRGKEEGLRRLRERRLGLGERPVDPLRQQRDVLCFHGRATPDAQTRRRAAEGGEIVAGPFLFHQGHQLLGEVGLRVRRQRRDRGIDHLHAHRGIGTYSRIL